MAILPMKVIREVFVAVNRPFSGGLKIILDTLLVMAYNGVMFRFDSMEGVWISTK
jgi:hypothetical protein